MPDPIIFERWQEAKKAAGHMARAIGAELKQMPDGSKRVILGKLIKDFPTWLSCYGYMWSIRADQIGYRHTK